MKPFRWVNYSILIKNHKISNTKGQAINPKKTGHAKFWIEILARDPVHIEKKKKAHEVIIGLVLGMKEG